MKKGRPLRKSGRPVSFQRRESYFEVPEELEPVLGLEPIPVLPEPEVLAPEPEVLAPEPVLPLPDVLLPVLGELEPLEDDEPLAPCSRRQRSFSEPVRLSHWVVPPRAGELVEELPLALGEVLDEPLVEEPVLPLALGVLPTPCDDDESAAIATAEAANSAASVAVESTFNIVASPM
ncbi:MAG: hypothetical protein QOD26_3777 [Betaproteobacteria bacterium]|jgi:hypothetical protein|nr:hypothetical protein [Betaproteobacteria bacterium]